MNIEVFFLNFKRRISSRQKYLFFHQIHQEIEVTKLHWFVNKLIQEQVKDTIVCESVLTLEKDVICRFKNPLTNPINIRVEKQHICTISKERFA